MLYSTKANAIDNENVSINQMYTYVLTFIEPVRLNWDSDWLIYLKKQGYIHQTYDYGRVTESQQKREL